MRARMILAADWPTNCASASELRLCESGDTAVTFCVQVASTPCSRIPEAGQRLTRFLLTPHMRPMTSSIRRVAGSVLLAVLLLGTTAPTAQAQLGVAAGLDFNSLDDIEASSQSETLDNSTGYHVGVVYDLGLGPVSVRPGVFYRKVGTYDFAGVEDIDQVDVTALEVPLDLRVTVFPFPLVSPYLVGGPNAFLPRSDNDALDDGLEDLSFTFNVGVGADVSVPGVGLTLQPELRYEFGATDYVNDFSVGDADFKPAEQSLSAFALRLNVLF